MFKFITLTEVIDDGSFSSYDWPKKPVHIRIDRIMGIGKSCLPSAKSEVLLKKGVSYHCREKRADVLELLKQNGWEEISSRGDT